MPATKPSVFRADPYLTLVDYARRYVSEARSGFTPENDFDCVRAWASIGGFDDLLGKVNTWILGGYEATNDTTRGWVREQPLPNFLEGRLPTITTAPQPLRMARGGTAAPLVVSTQYETWQLYRVALEFSLDEQDILDAADAGRPVTLNTIEAIMMAVGASFRRVALDCVYGHLLSNPTLVDGDDLFDTDRGNLGTAALSSGSLDTGYTAIAGAVRSAGEGIYAHENLTPRYLIVPPELMVAAGQLAASFEPSVTIEPRSESRLGSSAFLDAITNTARSGNGTNWMLAAPASQAPAIVLGLLNGRREPVVRSFTLDRGQWGVGFDVCLDIGVQAVDGRPVYWSTGAS